MATKTSPSPPPPIFAPAPPAAADSWWVVVGGEQFCNTVQNAEQCVTDGSGAHTNNEYCVIRATRALVASATPSFNTESVYDFITIAGTQYSGTSGPQNVVMQAGDSMTWYTDTSIVTGGFTICATSVPPMMPPTSPSRPPFPPPPPPSPPFTPSPPRPRALSSSSTAPSPTPPSLRRLLRRRRRLRPRPALPHRGALDAVPWAGDSFNVAEYKAGIGHDYVP